MAIAIAGAAGALAAEGKLLLSPFFPRGTALTADGMPGPVAAALAATLAAVGALLVAGAGVRLRALAGFGPAACARGCAARRAGAR